MTEMNPARGLGLGRAQKGRRLLVGSRIRAKVRRRTEPSVWVRTRCSGWGRMECVRNGNMLGGHWMMLETLRSLSSFSIREFTVTTEQGK